MSKDAELDERDDDDLKEMNYIFDTYGSPDIIKDIIETGELLYKEECKGVGSGFSHYTWSRAHRAHMNNISRLKTISHETK